MQRFKLVSFASALFILGTGIATAGPITIDGKWNDWGIDPGAPGGGQWNATTGSRIFFENYAGTDGTGFVSPGWGGQYFDVEAIYAQRQGSHLAFAVVTGFDPDGVIHMGHDYEPGDIFLNVGNGWNIGIDLQTGGIYANAVGSTPSYPESGPFTILQGDLIGTADLAATTDGLHTIYTRGMQSSTHHLIEGSLDLSLVGCDDQDAGIHWTMSCGNDVGEGWISPAPAPEPATIALFGLGALAVLARVRPSRTRRRE